MLKIKAIEKKCINLGRRGEDSAREILFDITDLVEEYGQGEAHLIAKREKDIDTYSAEIIQDNNIVRWTIKPVDNDQPGYGSCELVYIADGCVVKTTLYQTYTEVSLSDPVSPPDSPTTYASLSNRIKDNEEELEDARKGFDDTVHKSVGDAIRAQGVKIEVKHSESLGDNSLKQDTWRALPEGEIVSRDNGVIVVSHNEYYGDYLEQIKESTINPRVGYYVDDNLDELTDEVPGEAKYLTDAHYATASDVKGRSDLPYTVDEGLYVFNRVIPAAVLELSHPTRIGSVELTCRPREYSPIKFDIQVKDLKGEWVTVKSINGGGIFMYDSTENFTFDPVVGTDVRVLIYSCYHSYPKILEIVVYEVKSGRILEKIKPTSITTDAPRDSGLISSVSDGDKKTNFQTYTYSAGGNLIPFVFNFLDETVISRIKVLAYDNDNHTPKKIALDALIDGEWVGIFGGVETPNGEKPYTTVQIYEAGLTDTFVLDFEKDYKVSAIRLGVSSVIGKTPLVLNEVEFYGPAKSITEENSLGVVYDEYSTDLTQKAGDVWYFGAKVSGEKYAFGSSLHRPKVVLEADVSGEHKELCSSMTVSESLEDYYCAFTIPEDYSGAFTNLSVKVQYPKSEYLEGKTCKFSDFILVNLTEAYGAGNEPVADDYYKALRTSNMTIHSKESVQEFGSIPSPRGATEKTAYEYAVEGGYTGTEKEFIAEFSKGLIKKVYEHIATIAVSPDTDGSLPSIVDFTTDSEGNSFELTDFYIKGSAGCSAGGSTKFDLRVSTSAKNVLTESVFFYYTPSGISSTRCQRFYAFFREDDDGFIRAELTKFNNSGEPYLLANAIRLINPLDASDFTPVGIIRLQVQHGTHWLEGSTFELWGVRK